MRTTVVRLRPEVQGGHVHVKVFVGHGHQDDPDDINAGLAGTIVMSVDEWADVSLIGSGMGAGETSLDADGGRQVQVSVLSPVVLS